MDTKVIAADVARTLERSLPFQVPNFHKRIRITADTEKYKWEEDESVWLQYKDRAPVSFEVLFDGEYVCDFDLSEHENQVVVKMLQGMRDLFNTKKIYLHESMYRVAAVVKQETVTLPKPENEAEELVAKVFEKKAKKKGRKVLFTN